MRQYNKINKLSVPWDPKAAGQLRTVFYGEHWRKPMYNRKYFGLDDGD